MVKREGVGASVAGSPIDRQPTPVEKAETPKTEAPKAEPQTVATPAPKVTPALPVTEHGNETVPPPAKQPPSQPAKVDPRPTPKPIEAQPTPPPPQEAPVFDLTSTESGTDPLAMGLGILPASPDDRFQNRPPTYPIEAQLHNEHGSVVVVIHVSENGFATGVDVQQSSGVDQLDQAAVAAVRKWHFHPAMKDGHAVPFDFPFEFIFEPR